MKISELKQGDLTIKFFGEWHETEAGTDYVTLDSVTIGLNVGYGSSHTIAEPDLTDPIAKQRFVEMLPHPVFDNADQAEAYDRTFVECYLTEEVA